MWRTCPWTREADTYSETTKKTQRTTSWHICGLTTLQTDKQHLYNRRCKTARLESPPSFYVGCFARITSSNLEHSTQQLPRVAKVNSRGDPEFNILYCGIGGYDYNICAESDMQEVALLPGEMLNHTEFLSFQKFVLVANNAQRWSPKNLVSAWV